MHIYFSGIGGSGMSSLALMAKQAGYTVSGSDMVKTSYTDYLTRHGITDIHIGQSKEQIAEVHKANPINWLIYTPAIPLTHPSHPELTFAKENNIKANREDEFLQKIIADHGLKLIAIAGTHGKSTTTAMVVWLFKSLGVPVSYALGAKINFGDLSHFTPRGEYFVHEADEFDHKFLTFHPYFALITGIDWDHPDIYPSRGLYNEAFVKFLNQSRQAAMWENDRRKLNYSSDKLIVLDEAEPDIELEITLPGLVNRQNAWQVAVAMSHLLGRPRDELIKHLNAFPGLSRRFEQIAPNLYTDYAHTPPKIRGALQLARETAGEGVVVIYEGLHNTRQHFIKDELGHIFDDLKKLYIVPTFLAREDKNLKLLSPQDLLDLLSDTSKAHAETAALDSALAQKIRGHLEAGDLVLCLSAGSGESLDDWLRQTFATD